MDKQSSCGRPNYSPGPYPGRRARSNSRDRARSFNIARDGTTTPRASSRLNDEEQQDKWDSLLSGITALETANRNLAQMVAAMGAEAAAKLDGRYAESESKFKMVGDKVISVEQLAVVTDDKFETFRESTTNRLAGLESVVDEMSREYMGLNQPTPQTPQPEHIPISPERFIIGSPGGTLPSAAPPAGVFNQQSADFGTYPTSMPTKPDARYLTPELSGVP